MTKSQSAPPSVVSRLIRMVPVVGYAIRCLEGHRHGELALLGGNLLMAMAVGILVFGYPFLITAALCAAALAGLLILSATAG